MRFIGEQKRERRREVVELHKVSQRKKAMTFKRRFAGKTFPPGELEARRYRTGYEHAAR